MRRYIIEFGMGMDLHGQDVNKAAKKAVKDAVAKSCLCGLSEILNVGDLNEDVAIKVTVAVTKPEQVIPESIAKCLPIGKITVNAVTGGMKVAGLYVPSFGDKDDSIEVAVAAVEVYVNTSRV